MAYWKTMCRWSVFFQTMILVVMFVGCAQNQAADKLIKCQNENIALKERNEKLHKELISAQQTIRQQDQQIKNLEKLGPARIEELTRVDHIDLDRQTGGYDENHDGYDDGVAVFLRPLDAKGHTIKAAGSLRVKLFQLDGDEPKILGQCKFNAKEMDSKWVGRFWTNHYSVRCPFKTRPTSTHITAQVEFTELLTGKPFVAQKLIDIKLSPENDKSKNTSE
jgi:hypothetical protein